MPDSLTVLIRATIAFTSMVVFTRLMGKKAISQLTFFHYIVGITIGSIAATLSTDLSLKPFPQWVGLGAWVVLAIVFEFTVLKSRWWAKMLEGESTILIHNGKIMEQNMAANHYQLAELMEQLRGRGVFNPADVEFAILETDGNLTVLKKSQCQPVTPADLHIATTFKGISTELVQEGQIIDQNLKQLNLDEQWLLDELRKKGIADLKQVVYASLDTEGNLYVDKYKDELKQVTDISDYPGPN